MSGKKQNKIKITSFPRIHITLIGMNDDGYRINGGIGFSISTPHSDIHFEVSEEVEVIDERVLKLTEQEQERLYHVLMETINTFDFKKKIKCIIRGSALPHYGLGSGTTVYLSCIEALFILNKKEYNHNNVVLASKRGGTSGIGINTYFEGGFIFDVGIKNSAQSFVPDSVITDRKNEKPLVMHKCKLPDWQIGVCIPTYIQNKSHHEEVEFFKKTLPLDKASVDSILYEAVYGITASIIENDYEAFCKSVNTIQFTKWKYMERLLYGEDLIELEQKIKFFGADCVGMSSLGPILFFTGKNINGIVEQISSNIPEVVCYSTSFNNQGRIINYD